MKKSVLFLLAGIILFCACEQTAELPNAKSFSKIPETNVAEAQLGVVKYSYNDLLSATADVCYEEWAIYDCYKKDGETYYIMNRRDDNPDNANQLIGMDGIYPFFIEIHDGYYSWTGGAPDYQVKLCNYEFNEGAQTLNGICSYYSYVDMPHNLIYLDKECFILQIDTPWKRMSAEKGAKFSRVVYRQTERFTHPVIPDTIDCRK